MIKFFIKRGQVFVLGVFVCMLGVFVPRITLHALKTALKDFHFEEY